MPADVVSCLTAISVCRQENEWEYVAWVLIGVVLTMLVGGSGEGWGGGGAGKWSTARCRL